jgi:flagellar hook-length control protein FliK
MNQIAAFFSQAAAPGATAAGVRAVETATAGEGFAALLAQLQQFVGAADAATPANNAAAPQIQNLLGATDAAATPDLTLFPQATKVGEPTPTTPVDAQSLLDLLAALGAQAPGKAQTTILTETPNAAPDTTLAAQLAALQLALQNIQAQPENASPTPAAQSNAPAPDATALGLRATLVPPTIAGAEADASAQPQQTDAPAPKAPPAPVPSILPVAQTHSDANATARTTAKLAAPKRAGDAAPAAPDAQPQSLKDAKAPDIATPIAPAAASHAQSKTQQSAVKPVAAQSSQTPQAPSAPVASPVLPNTLAAQQFEVTVTTAPQAVPLEALAVHIARKFEGGASQFEIRLNPAELGKLDISLSVAEDGRVQAVLRVERPETLDMLQRDARVLEQQLRQAGLDVGSNALSFSLSHGNNGRQPTFTGWPAFAEAGDVADAAKEEAVAHLAVRTRDGVDIRI